MKLFCLILVAGFLTITQASSITVKGKHEEIVIELDGGDMVEIEQDDEQQVNIFESHVEEVQEELNPETDDIPDPEAVNRGCPKCCHPKPAKWCNDHVCNSTNCRCSSEHIPGGKPRSRTPQMIVLSFQNAVQSTNFRLYQELFEGRRNPNNCSASGTFFVSSKYTNYYYVQSLYSQGHEIGMNAAEEFNLQNFWFDATVSDWSQQMKDNRATLTKWANVNVSDIRGWRSPYLYMGGNTQMCAMEDAGVTYDSTRVAINRKNDPSLLWPYSYQYQSTQSCPIGICPNGSFPRYPGDKPMWEVPVESLYDSRDVPCAEAQGCYFKNKAEVFDGFYEAFKERYNHNRAPLTVSISTAFLLTDYKFYGLTQFLDEVQKKSDVYLVSAWRALQYTRFPKGGICPPCSKHCRPSALDCPADSIRPKPCARPKTCNYDKNRKFVPAASSGIIYVMQTCNTCPGCYPVYKDPKGQHC